MRLLAVGDLHLGRQPARLPDTLRERVSPRDLGPAAALDRLVREATRQGVDAVVFAGDVVEQEDDFFEAFATLRRAVTTLVDHGIAVLGVAGNHDVQVLPRLAEEVTGFRLLGADGHWESATMEDSDGVCVDIVGWSFPRSTPGVNPLAAGQPARGNRPTLGLLHCDRDQPGSPHAPVSAQELAAAGVDAWLLGHIHKPDRLGPQQPSGYLGSVTALRASETGVRGPWLYTIGPGGIEDVTQWPLAPLRWEELTVDVTGATEAGEIPQSILAAAERCATDLRAQPWQPELLGLRLTLTGRSNLGRAISERLEREDLTDLPLQGITAFVGRWWLDLRPEIDLATLARRHDPVGLLAQRLRLLDEAPASDPERQALIERAREHLARSQREAPWRELTTGDPDDEQVIGWLRTGAMNVLDELLAQHAAEVDE